MRKKFFSITVIIALIFAMVNIREDVQAASKKVYEFYETDCAKFVKSKGRLKVKVVKEWGHGLYLNDADGYRTIDKQKLDIPLSKNCKWSMDYVGDTGYLKHSYKKIRANIEKARVEFLEEGSYSSPGNVQIIVKNGKVIRVNVRYS